MTRSGNFATCCGRACFWSIARSKARRSVTALLDKYNVAMPEALPPLPRLQADLFEAQRAHAYSFLHPGNPAA